MTAYGKVKNIIEHFKNSRALLIGITKYKFSEQINQGVNEIKYAHKDAYKLKKVFKSFGFQHVERLYNKQATKGNIVECLNSLCKLSDNASLVVIFWAGHGALSEQDLDPKTSYLLPYNAEVGNFYNTAISVADFLYFASNIKAKNIVVLMDTCHAHPNPQTPNRFPASDFYRIFKLNGKNCIFMGACYHDEYSIESNALKRGLFSFCVEKGLTGTPLSQNDHVECDDCGCITLDHLMLTFRKWFQAQFEQYAEYNINQTPYISGEWSHASDIIIGQSTRKFSEVVIENSGLSKNIIEASKAVIDLKWLEGL